MSSSRLITKRHLYIILAFIIILFIITFDYTRNKIPVEASKVVDSPSHDQSSSVSQTCLVAYDSKRLHNSLFHSSMVHVSKPTTLNHWIGNKTGFEIGGPSQQTWGSLGVYDQAAKVDVTNFAADTLWESGLKDGSTFMWNKQSKGIQYIRDAIDLKGIPNDHYDFVLASHVIEHIANPFKALLEWIRILRPGGLLMIIAPWKDVTFDHKRPIDRIEHLIDDYHKNVTEADLSHLEEILRLHDLVLDPPAGNIDSFRARSEKNLQNRGLHQHVYDHELLYQIYLCLNLNVKIQYTWGNCQLIIGQKK